MKFRVAREVLADAVAWTARSLPPRPSVPVLAGILLEVDGNQLSVSGFDYEVSARAEVDVHATEGGRALVPGRLLAEITRALPPHPVEITAEGPRLSIACSNARFSLPTLPVEDYPSLPSMPSSAGVVDSDVFAEAVGQVAVAAGRDDTLPMLTGVRLEIEDDVITLAATDRYRLAVREFAWRPETPGVSAAVLVPARTLADAAKTLTSGPEIVVSLSSGVHSSSRTANRNRSVAARVSRGPSISRRTPVSMGSVSSRPAATATCCTAWASTSPATMPATWGMAGSCG